MEQINSTDIVRLILELSPQVIKLINTIVEASTEHTFLETCTYIISGVFQNPHLQDQATKMDFAKNALRLFLAKNNVLLTDEQLAGIVLLSLADPQIKKRLG